MLQTVIRWLLAISLLVNLVLGVFFYRQHTAAVEAKDEARQAVASAQACSDGVATLKQQADKRQAAAAPKIAAAASAARALQQQANRILATPPAVPGDECASAKAERDAWWTGRAKP